jgi:homocysteine S-methyltransferase
MILDGGLATTLEAMGHSLAGALWSARILDEAPEAIAGAHAAFLAAGAGCIIGASYQASIQGFLDYGLSEEMAVVLLHRSVGIARKARDDFWGANPDPQRLKPLVAASIGPYGATRSDGSEYSGEYGLSLEALTDFHHPRWQILAEAGPDLMACETIPSAIEVEALLAVLDDSPPVPAWISLSCRDDAHLNDGTPIADVAALCDGVPGLVALGVNCTAPDHIGGLIAAIRTATALPVVVYPNAGGCYDAEAQDWGKPPVIFDWTEAAAHWHRDGASVIGGCCRVDPDTIRALRAALATSGEP